jgi:hypothetical protein
MNAFNVCVPLYSGGTIAVGTAYDLAFKVPTDDIGGGVTIVAAGISSRLAIDSGSAPVFELVTLGTNSAVNGTLGTVAAGAFTAGTVKALTITSDWAESPYYVAFKNMGTAANGDQTYINGYIQYVMGK